MKAAIPTHCLLIAGILIQLSTTSFAQTYEVFDQNLKLKSRIEFDQISILGDAVRISSSNNEIKLLNKEYKPFYNLKAQNVHVYAEPWLIVSGAGGKGAFHEYGEEIFEMDYDEIQTSYTRVVANKGNIFWMYDRMTKERKLLGEFENIRIAPNEQLIAKSAAGFLLPASPNPEKVYKNIQTAGSDFLMVEGDSGHGLVNRDGELILDTILERLQHIEGDYFYGYDENQYMLIRGKEEKADIRYVSYHKITFEDDMILEYIHGKLRRVMKNDGILLDQVGMERVVPVGEKHFNIFMRDKKIGLLGPKGWEVNPVSDVEKILPGNEALFGAMKAGKFGFIDRSGRWVVQNQFDEVRKFNEGLAAFRINNQWGFVNNQGTIIVSSQYDQVSDYKRGLAIVSHNGGQSLIDFKGESLTSEMDFTRISIGTDGYFYTETRGKYGLLSTNGQEIVKPIFDVLRREENNRVLVRLDNKYGLMDESGNYLLPLYYKNIIFDTSNRQILAEDHYQFPQGESVAKSGKKKKPSLP
jgi:hypothetical protein